MGLVKFWNPVLPPNLFRFFPKKVVCQSDGAYFCEIRLELPPLNWLTRELLHPFGFAVDFPYSIEKPGKRILASFDSSGIADSANGLYALDSISCLALRGLEKRG